MHMELASSSGSINGLQRSPAIRRGINGDIPELRHKTVEYNGLANIHESRRCVVLPQVS